MTWPRPDHLTQYITLSEQFYKVIYLANFKILLLSDQKLRLDIRPILDTRTISTITSSVLKLISTVLCVYEPKDSEYPSTNFFPN